MEGKIRYYGVALNDEPESEEAGEGAIDVRSVSSLQTEFSLLKQQPGRNLILRAQDAATAILAYDPSVSARWRNLLMSSRPTRPSISGERFTRRDSMAGMP